MDINNLKKLFEDKNNIIIFVLSLIILILLVIFLTHKSCDDFTNTTNIVNNEDDNIQYSYHIIYDMSSKPITQYILVKYSQLNYEQQKFIINKNIIPTSLVDHDDALEAVNYKIKISLEYEPLFVIPIVKSVDPSLVYDDPLICFDGNFNLYDVTNFNKNKIMNIIPRKDKIICIYTDDYKIDHLIIRYNTETNVNNKKKFTDIIVQDNKINNKYVNLLQIDGSNIYKLFLSDSSTNLIISPSVLRLI